MKTTKSRNKVQQPFARILTALLKERKVTIAQAAKACGVGPSTISDWKDGSSPENYIAVQKLAQFLGVSFSFLLTGVEDSRGTNPSITEIFDDGGEIFDGYAKITVQRLIVKTKK